MNRLRIAMMVLALAAMGPITESHALDAFLWIEGIRGGSLEPRHPGWIDISSVGFGHKMAPISGGRVGPPQFDPITITKSIDASSPILALAAAAGGQPYKRAIIELWHNVASKGPFMKIELELVSVTAYNASASEAGQGATENASLSYGKIRWTVSPVDSKGGLGPPVTAAYDLTTGKAQ